MPQENTMNVAVNAWAKSASATRPLGKVDVDYDDGGRITNDGDFWLAPTSVGAPRKRVADVMRPNEALVIDTQALAEHIEATKRVYTIPSPPVNLAARRAGDDLITVGFEVMGQRVNRDGTITILVVGDPYWDKVTLGEVGRTLAKMHPNTSITMKRGGDGNLAITFAPKVG